MKFCCDITLKDTIISIMMTVITIKHSSCSAAAQLLLRLVLLMQAAETEQLSPA